MLNVTIIPILQDNYSYIIQSGNTVGVVDPGDANPIIETLEKNNLTPSFILNTHHHWDHINGNKKIKKKYNLQIMGPEGEKEKIPEIDTPLNHDEVFQFGNETVQVIKTAGHTLGHICYYFQNSKILFAGDTLFSLGCGRLFEGTAKQLYNSFKKLKELPDETQIYCAHEYTLANGEFCQHIDPENKALLNRIIEAKILRGAGKPTLPTFLKIEKETNSFLRAKNAQDLKKLRDLKDNF